MEIEMQNQILKEKLESLTEEIKTYETKEAVNQTILNII